MPTPRKLEEVKAEHFTWRLYRRNGVYGADGRHNAVDVGRHSLGTRDRAAAINAVRQLDRVQAAGLGLIVPERNPTQPATSLAPVTIAEGRRLYEMYLRRPAATGGVKLSTYKRYRTSLDKFGKYCAKRNIGSWNLVDAAILEGFIGWLEREGYHRKSIVNEVTTIKQVFGYLLDNGKLQGCEAIRLKVKKAESRPAYCWTPDQVAAMLGHAKNDAGLRWLHDVVLALACTGLRIAELAGLRWSDVDLNNGMLSLTDETGYSDSTGARRQLKSGRSRSFPIHADLMRLLREMPHRSRYIFVGPRGGKLKPDTVGRRLRKSILEPLAERFPSSEGVRGFVNGTPHSFRHYFCSTCSNGGVPERIVMQWLGHADSAMIRNYYHLSDAESRRKMDQLQFLGDPPRGESAASGTPPVTERRTSDLA
ncbi:Tyrosine recombinase XerD [Pirellulimonas nuda]|uniref:Tyrosine recombinase XerD n=2 Tax=Pirellulimonas nuda TaxID=2528009 RepID=A0A518DAF9_9BACT|nr:Tyrosine recombinase XerD [Pirellulimonas nuda]